MISLPALGTEADCLLVVDDEEPIRRSFGRQLERVGYPVLTAGSCAEADDRLRERDVSLVLCDIDLPGESGMSFARRVGDTHPECAVLMVTGVDDPVTASAAIEAGAYGYLIKPVEHNELVINVANALRRRTLEISQRRDRAELEALVKERTDELRLAYEELISRMAVAADSRDPETAAHIDRMSLYSELLARAVGLPADEVELIRVAAPMHDIGKIGIPDDILRKPGRYTDEERDVMKHHPTIGYQILQGSKSPLVRLAADIARTHHEWYDGAGYPAGLAGEEIPIAGRIVAIADVYDALRSRRCYKDGMAADEAFATMMEERGRHFDPQLLDLFIAARAEIDEISARY